MDKKMETKIYFIGVIWDVCGPRIFIFEKLHGFVFPVWAGLGCGGDVTVYSVLNGWHPTTLAI